MRFGLALPHYDFSFPDGGPVSHERVRDVALRAEQLGFDSVWISDHFFLSLRRYGGSPEPSGSLEPMTTLAALAAETERVRLGTLVLSAPFRPVGILAKTATAVDLVSGGRLDLGVGAGWYEDEFRAFGYPFGETGERFEQLEETLQGLSLLFGEGPASLEGRHVKLDGAYNRPRAAQEPRPRMWLGAKGGPRALRLAARYADGWNVVWREPPDYGERIRAARAACEREGRDPSTLRLSIGLYTLLGENESDLAARFSALQRWAPGGALDGTSLEDYAKDTLVGTPERVTERIGSLADLGVEEIVIGAASLPFAVHDLEQLELFAETVIAPARA